MIKDSVLLPLYPIAKEVIEAYPKAIVEIKNQLTIKSGSRFMFNEDILIPTESLSMGAMGWIRNKELYKKKELDDLHKDFKDKKIKALQAPQDYIVTKHMYWPVKATGLSAIPVWHDDYKASDTVYAGYEKWKRLIAVDPSGKYVGQTKKVTYLHGVWEQLDDTVVVDPVKIDMKLYKKLEPITAAAKVYGLKDFYYHKVTQTEWDKDFDENDKAILNASSYWAYNKPFGPDDYLVTIAMHINTKEISSWALQSVWWTDKPDDGPEAANRPEIPLAKGPWEHYKLIDSYGIPEKLGGDLPVAMNPYIELAVHPVATNCQNCHRRAGWPMGSDAGTTSYQNSKCASLVEDLKSDNPCFDGVLLTDFQWLIPDHAQPEDNK